MAYHHLEPFESRHPPINGEYADATARLAATGFTLSYTFQASDVGGFARQLDDNSIWMLTDIAPVTWVAVGSGGSVAAHATTHENGGSDEISVAGLSGVLADAQTPTSHASSHQNGGSDEVATATPAANAIPKADGTGKLNSGWIPATAVPSHATTHENGGADEISVAGLSGVLADAQTPTSHASSHQNGGADEVATATPAANAIPKADGTGKLNSGWIPTLTVPSHATTHENGGADEISVAGLSGVLADAQTPTAHATTHENGGADEISVAGLSGVLADAQTPTSHASSHQNGGADEVATATPAANAIPKAEGTGKLNSGWIPATAPAAHATTHENGGADEISVAGLSGTLADPQTPTSHATTHENGGADEISVAGLSGVLADAQNADKLQSRNISSTIPNDAEHLKWNNTASQWEPSKIVSADHARFDSLTADPTVVAVGYVWYRSDLDEYRCRFSGITYTLGKLPFDRIITVSKTSPIADYSTIAAAIAAASSGDVILVSPESYAESLTLKAGVRIIGTGGGCQAGTRTVIGYTFSGDGTVITGPASGTAYIENLYVNANHAVNYNIRALTVGAGTIEATCCVFITQSLAGFGGSCYAVNAASTGLLYLDNCRVIVGNSGSFLIDAIGLEISGATSVYSKGTCYEGSGTQLYYAVRVNNAGATLRLQAGCHLYGGLNVAAAAHVYIDTATWIDSTTGILDTDQETITEVRPYGLVRTSGLNDQYKLHLRELTANPVSPGDGEMWYHGTDEKFRIRIKGVTKALGQPPFNGLVITCDPTDPTADYSTFAAACAAATSGSIILLGPGQYACSDVTIPAGVTVQGVGRFGTGPTILHASPSVSGFTVGVSSGIVSLRDVFVRCYASITTGTVQAINVTGGALYLENVRAYIFDDGSIGGNAYALHLNGGNAYLHQSSCEVVDAVTFTLRAGVRVDGANSIEAWDSYFESISDSVRFENAGATGTFISCSMPNIIRVTSASAVYLDVATRTGQIIDAGNKVLIRGPAINYYQEKTAPVSADKLLIADSADSHKMKMAQIGSLIAGGLEETGGPTDLAMAGVADGQYLRRSGTSIVGSTPSGSGDVVGPAGATDNAIARFDTATGKLLQNSGILVADANAFELPEISTPTAPASGYSRLYAYSRYGRNVLRYLTSNSNEFQICQDNVLVMRNETGSPISAFTPVYEIGTGSGGEPLIGLAKADSLTTLPAIGITVESIANNSSGFVMFLGVLAGINTTGFSVGDIVYVSAATAGALTTTPPAYPNYRQRVGRILTSAVSGTALVWARAEKAVVIQRLELGVSSPSAAITTGAKGRKAVSIAGTIVGWRLVADQSTTTVLDIWKVNNAIPTVANTITASAKPSLTAAELNGSMTLTGWTTAVAVGDVFILNVDSNNNARYLALELSIQVP